jgi:hypothetical protein
METEVYFEMAEVQEIHWWFAARRRIIASVIRGEAFLPRRKSWKLVVVLEVTCPC